MEEVTSFMKYQTISSNKEEIEPLKENEDESVLDVNNNPVNISNQKPISTTELYTTITTATATATTKQQPQPVKDDNSVSSSKTSLSSQQTYMCRICHCEETSEEFLLTPCHCTGTLRHVHQACLQQWLKSNGMKSCELCKFEFIMQTKIRPFKEWQKLDMNRIEKRKIMCSVAFHVIAITCVVWSLYVLIDRTAEEIRKGLLGQWPFWTKIVVVAIGFTGGVVFMYIQCKMYLQLCIRWKQYNRVIIIQPINEDLLKKSKKLREQQLLMGNQLKPKLVNAFKFHKNNSNKSRTSVTTSSNVNNNVNTSNNVTHSQNDESNNNFIINMATINP